jgi:hypothetical protein
MKKDNIRRQNGDKVQKKSSVAKKEIITDQSDPRFIEFKKEYGDFLSKGNRKLHRLDITENKAKPGEMKVTLKLGFYEGEPPAAWRKFWQKIITETKISNIDHKDHDSISE